jgi:hypothetical protein
VCAWKLGSVRCMEGRVVMTGLFEDWGMVGSKWRAIAAAMTVTYTQVVDVLVSIV